MTVAPTEDEEVLELETEEEETPEAPEDQEQDDELVLSFNDEVPEETEEETPLVRRLREELRDRTRELRETRQGIDHKPEVIEVGEEPDLEAFDYDQAAWKEAWTKWNNRRLDAEKAEAVAAEEAEKAKKEWSARLADYERKKSELRVPGKEEAEAEAVAHLSQYQQAVIVKYADNPAALIIALGKSPKKLEALSGMNDLAQFTFTVAKLEKELNVGKKKAPEPEGMVRGSAPLSNVGDKYLEKLEREAARTGDRTEIARYKAQLKKK